MELETFDPISTFERMILMTPSEFNLELKNLQENTLSQPKNTSTFYKELLFNLESMMYLYKQPDLEPIEKTYQFLI